MKVNRIVPFILAVIVLIAVIPGAGTAAQAAQPTDIRAIPGIDYDRFTREITKGATAYTVELKLGELSFPGKLTGNLGLTIEEMNTVINDVLKDKNLTVQKIALVSSLAANLQNDAKAAWGDQIIEGLLKFIPSIPGYGVNDYYNWVVHGEGKTADAARLDIDKQAVIKLIENKVKLGALKNAKGAGKKIPMLGQIVTTLELADEWLEGSKRFEDYKKKLEDGMAEVTGFYAECSRRMNDLVEKRGDIAWRLDFDNPTVTYNCTLWDISGVMIEATLSGSLVRQQIGAADNYGGTYEGTLTIVFRGVDMKNSFDAKFRDTEDFLNGGGMYPSGEKVLWTNQGITDIKDEYSATEVSRTVSGELSVYVPEGSGVIDTTVSGSLTGGRDETVFSFSHKITGTGTSKSAGATVKLIGTIEYSSTDIGLYYYRTAKTANGVTLTDDVTSGTVFTDIGTIWNPLGSEPEIYITVK